jgi:predicted pyridoxine 5'-phosphate oxidase superfamily flavin-nucleotide-binding protein
MSTAVYHEGERIVQQMAGEAAIADRNGAVVAGTILNGAQPFLRKLSMAVLASVDAMGMPCATVLYGESGFIQADSATSLRIALPLDRRDLTDPLWTNLAGNVALGMLFIELGSRRRYRINGALRHIDETGMAVQVRQAYPNCPKYIQRRHLRALDGETMPARLDEGRALAGAVRSIVTAADTVFVASNHARTGADASHRGGNPGFVQVVHDRLLRMPDYPGNSIFNTFGNLIIDSRVGLCVPDFDGQRMLQISGRARILFDQPDPGQLTGGSGRFWEIEVERWQLRHVPRRLQWEYLDASPFNPPTAQP